MLYPYQFEPILVERVWGGTELARYGRNIPDGKKIGETWEISDRPKEQSVVANGPDKGKTLRQLMETLGSQLLGQYCDATKPFPLLVKLLDARERLSLQVHPPPTIAPKLGGEPKTEMWYILDAAPDAQLIAGMKAGATGADFQRALDDNTVENCVHRFPVKAGDTMFIPSGRVHAIDAGLVLVEIQQNSDTTYRVYDWGRPRELHIKESILSIDFQDVAPQKQKPQAEYRGVNGLWRLVECEYFHVHKLTLRNAWTDRCDGNSFHILTCVAGQLGLLTSDGKEEILSIGDFVLLPAALGHYTLSPLAENTAALKTFVPRLAAGL